MIHKQKQRIALAIVGSLVCLGVSQAQNTPTRTIAEEQVAISTPTSPARSLKWKVAIGRFSNETQYGKGIFYDRENDPMAKQAYDILSTKLSASGKFILLERGDIDVIEKELASGGVASNRIGADYVILGSITEFGRKTTGSEGLFTSKKTQTVEAGVSIRIVDVSTGLVIYSEEGKGSAEVSTKTTLGLGGKAEYDATLSDKAISGAVDQLVENIINKCTDKPWRTYLINADEDGTIIAGGSSQGLRVGDTLVVMSRGKKVKNPQTGATIELPGKAVATIRIEMLSGDTLETEIAFVSLVSGAFDATKLDQYYVQYQPTQP